ncbi:MAG: amidase [Gammaproteobacteria bacterium]|jgi:amidase|nr:Asp-tRNA(Asn)/Glu-tRNA(Gln) amidotransferase GatCAB subunit A [Chromatiales bacterium]MDP6674165.1 amidase [Gammaproteobacteria bacterium]
MPFKLPDRQELQRLAAELGRPLGAARADALLEYMQPFEMGFQYLDQEAVELPSVRYPSRTFHFPAPDENPLGAWYVKTEIAGAASGPLHGKRIAVKDNMFVADTPMMYGTEFLEGLVPEFDASVVTRVLDAGATIVGKTVCEYLCMHGGSTTSSTGFVHNPHNPDYSAGGSSSGSAALVVAGEIDMALGTDQAGSVRIPASWSGAVGMKATHGLVPFTGVAGLEATMDHVGPITANVADNALLLEVLAGTDGLDSRQRQLSVQPYGESLGKPVTGMRIGVVREGFEHPHSSSTVNECVRTAAARFKELGADISEISIPMHFPGIAIWSGLLMEPVWHSLQTGGAQFNADGLYSPAFVDAMQDWQSRVEQVPVNLLMVMLFGQYMQRFGGQYYARARNLLPRLRQAYDQAFETCDLLLLPTTITQASRLPATPEELTDEHIITDLFGTSGNTCQFDATGHPALSMPCGMPGGLPVGMMLVAKPFDEPAIYRAASAFEQAG